MASNAAACTSRRVSMNFTASSACSVLRKWLPTADCSTSLTRFRIVPTIEMTLGARVSGTWICTCRSIWNTKPSRLLPTIDDSCASRSCASDVASAQFNVRMNVGTISASYTRGLMGYLPVRSGSSQMPRWPGRTIDPNLNSAPDVSSVGSPTKPLITATSPWFTTSMGTRSTRTRNGFNRYAPYSSGSCCNPILPPASRNFW